MNIIITVLFCIFVVISSAIELNSNLLLEEKLSNGFPVDSDQFPYVASLKNLKGHYCTGVVITEVHILTAARCIKLAYYYDTSLKCITIVISNTTYNILKMNNHPTYSTRDSGRHSENDIGIITITQETTVPPVNLPNVTDAQFLYEGTHTLFIGCSQNGDIAKYAILSLLIVDHGRCSYLNTYRRSTHDKLFCTYPDQFNKREATVSNEDVGGPLLGRRKLLGILSIDHLNANNRAITFTRIVDHLDFINSIINTKVLSEIQNTSDSLNER